MPEGKLRFSDVAHAIGTTPKSLRNWLSRDQVSLSSQKPATGWREFEYDDIPKLALVRRIVDFGIEVPKADYIAEGILKHGVVNMTDAPTLPVELPDGTRLEIRDVDAVLWPSEGDWNYSPFFQSAQIEPAITQNLAALNLRIGRIIAEAYLRIKERMAA